MKDFEKKVYKHLKDRNWHNLRPSEEEIKKDKVKLEKIKGELADVLIYCFEMSVLLGLDTEKIMRKKLAYAGKKYPAKLMRVRTGEPGTEDNYWRIKQEYRSKAAK